MWSWWSLMKTFSSVLVVSSNWKLLGGIVNAIFAWVVEKG